MPVSLVVVALIQLEFFREKNKQKKPQKQIAKKTPLKN